jgi:hypothetical protein
MPKLLAPVIVMMTLLTASGQAQAVPHARPGVLSPTSVTGRRQVDADRLYLEITGTARQRGAGDLRAYRVEENPLTRCVRAAGLRYTPEAFVDQWINWPSAGSSTSDTGFLAATDRPEYLVLLEQSKAAAERVAAADDVAYGKAFESLSATAQVTRRAAFASCSEGRGYAEVWHPRRYDVLDYAYHGVLDAIDVRIARKFEAPYESCMASGGYPGLRDHEDLQDFLESKLPSIDSIPPLGGRGNASWRAWVSLEGSAVAMDGRCRSAAYAEGMSLLAPAIRQFESAHAAQLAQETAGWDEIVKAAG